jgi:hypothetical protein
VTSYEIVDTRLNSQYICPKSNNALGKKERTRVGLPR